MKHLLALLGITCALTLVACPSGDDDDSTTGDDDDVTADDDDDTTANTTPIVLEIAHEPLDLTELAMEAIELAPDWLQDDLAVAFDAQGTTDQDDLAMLIVDEEDLYLIDEIAFAIAHTSPEVLSYGSFYPELLTINAELIYAYDPFLEFVQIEDVGEPGVDADYYTTTTYRIEDESGNVVEKTVDRDIYYWYVVHPRLEDEWPLFIDGWASANASSPENGWFWREFLWDAAEEECPEDKTCYLLQDYFTDIDVVWKSKAESDTDNGAIGELIHFVKDTIDFGAGDERPVQPVRIYTVERGNCGEHADLSSAAARTVLIPCRNVGARSNDHTWDEFWDDRWIAWEPIGTHVDYFGYYKGGVGRDGEDDNCDGLADDGLSTDDADGDGFSPAAFDCDDNDADVFPGATEVHNGYDDDCDGVADPGMSEADLDADGDGFSISTGDCDDMDADAYPGAEEVVDGVDDDCDGIADDGLDESDADADGFSILAGDCDDNDASRYPGAAETSNAVDDNCDGVADDGFLDPHLDRDGDGFTVADGDCNDWVATCYPGAPETENRIDDDCDGTADSGVDLDDLDGDGYEIIFGDCDDTNADVYPGAPELSNGYDDNCDGAADEGLQGHDHDGDGWTIEDGDCDDLDAGRHPDAQDPSLSGNRLYAMTGARGDTYITTDMTDNYVTNPSYLEFEVTDSQGRPVDGAVVVIYGTWAVYGYPDYWTWAAELITDLNGYAFSTVGEFNPYGYAVYSEIGDDPGGDSLYQGVEQSVAFETYVLPTALSASMPAEPAASEVSPGDAEMTVEFTFAVDGHRIGVDGSYLGSMSMEGDGGHVAAYVMDAANYNLYRDGEDFEAVVIETGSEGGTFSADLSRDKTWAVVLSNKSVTSTTMLGSVEVSVVPAGGVVWDEDVAPLATRFQIPPGEFMAFSLDD
jgi:hypothetical protein